MVRCAATDPAAEALALSFVCAKVRRLNWNSPSMKKQCFNLAHAVMVQPAVLALSIAAAKVAAQSAAPLPRKPRLWSIYRAYRMMFG